MALAIDRAWVSVARMMSQSFAADRAYCRSISPGFVASTMPIPTVSKDSGSMRMKLPVSLQSM
jgi:hypothetical protein